MDYGRLWSRFWWVLQPFQCQWSASVPVPVLRNTQGAEWLNLLSTNARAQVGLAFCFVQGEGSDTVFHSGWLHSNFAHTLSWQVVEMFKRFAQNCNGSSPFLHRASLFGTARRFSTFGTKASTQSPLWTSTRVFLAANGLGLGISLATVHAHVRMHLHTRENIHMHTYICT